VTKKGTGHKEEVYEVKIFRVPYPIEEIKENITVITNNLAEKTKESLSNKALRLHSQGKISSSRVLSIHYK